MNRSWWVIAFLYAAAPAFASACTPPAPAPRLPEESDEAYSVRAKALTSADDDEMYRSIQDRFQKDARRVTIGIIDKVEPISLPDSPGGGQKVAVRPMKMLKGEPSRRPIILADESLSTCGWVGGGQATHGNVGEYVVVFEGLDLSGKKDQSYGLLASKARHPELLKALFDFGVEAMRAEEAK